MEPAVCVTGVIAEESACMFNTPFQFKVQFECRQALAEDIAWKVIYVGCADDDSKDQVLGEVLVGPMEEGFHEFMLLAQAPDASLVPPAHLLGVTVVLVTASYRSQEFIRIGYYCFNELVEDAEHTNLSRVTRTLYGDKPRVTRFTIPWDQPLMIEGTATISSSKSLDAADVNMGGRGIIC